MNVGDYVVVTDEFDDNDRIKGKMAKIIGTRRSTNYPVLYRLEFEEWVNGHSSDGYGKYGYCWNVPKELCQPVDNSIKVLLKIRGENSS